ncbi:MAG: hypothetical protein AAB699_00335 [Patescibacteria group bacterium]
MDTREQQRKLLEFAAALPDSVRQAFRARGDFDIVLALSEMGDKYGLLIDEMHWLYEGTRRVLAGEDSASNLVSFLEKNVDFEEESRPKIPQIAAEIQRQIFDPVLPMLKAAGMSVKEGKVAIPVAPISKSQFPISNEERGAPTPPSSPLNATRYTLNASPADERHIRALTRIATGTSYSETQLREAFEDLPTGLRQAISSVDTANAVQEIAKQFLLHVDQMGALASETGLVLLGQTHPRNFVKNLSARLRVSEARALEIAKEISAQILSKVREALRGLHESPLTRGALPSSAGGVLQHPPTPFTKRETTPLRPESETPFAKGDREAEPLKRRELEKSATPFSTSAKWNVGDNILKRQTEENLNREELLRGIEHPTPTLNANRYPPKGGLNASPVGPTGWRPPARGTSGELEVSSSKFQVPTPTTHPPTPPPRGLGASPLAEEAGTEEGAEKRRPKSEAVNSQELKVDSSAKGSLLDQKLAEPMQNESETKRYTTDPYREPLE